MVVDWSRLCCLCTLGTGSKIIAFCYSIITGGILIFFSVMLSYFKTDVEPLIDRVISELPSDAVPFITSFGMEPNSDFAKFTTIAKILAGRNVLIAVIIINLVYLTFCISLYIGVSKRSCRLMIPWIAFDLIRQTFVFVIFIFTTWCLWILVNYMQYKSSVPLAVFFLMLFSIGFTFYFWLVVRATMLGLRKKETLKIVPAEHQGRSELPNADA